MQLIEYESNQTTKNELLKLCYQLGMTNSACHIN